jgi:hypothetical protein
MPTFASAFRLGKSQSELDFVDIALQRDNRLFLDPFAISQKLDRWSQSAASTIRIFFQQVVDDIRANRHEHAHQLLMHLREPNETRLGFSKGRSQGAVSASFKPTRYSKL